LPLTDHDNNPRGKTMIERLQGRAPVCVAALAGCMALAAPASAQRTAESIWSGGPSLTMNDKAMRAEAVTVANGRVLAVGRRSDEMKLRGPATQLVDLEGRTLVPGFVDAHGHIVIGGLQALSADLGPWHWSLTKGRGAWSSLNSKFCCRSAARVLDICSA
jgi:cytosine/adenosine deaminase-related metal-dependent hydrolase